MVVDLRPHMADMPPAIWQYLEKINHQVITERNSTGKVPDREDLDKIARMIGHYRRRIAASNRRG